MNSIFEGFLSSSEALEIFSESNFLQAMLRFEAALARAQASVGLIPQDAAQSIIGTCKVELFDVAKIVRESVRAGNLATPLVKSLRETVGLFNKDAANFVHFGCSSQDLIDTALALVTRKALALIEMDVDKALAGLLALAGRHAGDPVLARALMQPASVTSFGLRCAGWAAPLVRSRQRLRSCAAKTLSVQLEGTPGTLAQMKGLGPQILALMATELRLEAPGSAWHTQRDEWVALGCELGLLVGNLGKIANDIALMAQHEVGELVGLLEPGLSGAPGISRQGDPLDCRVALAAARRMPQRIAALLAAPPQEHERALGNWQADLAEWPALVMSAQDCARAMAHALSGLQVNTQRMLVNLEALRTVLPAQTVSEYFSNARVQQAAELTCQQVDALGQACMLRPVQYSDVPTID